MRSFRLPATLFAIVSLVASPTFALAAADGLGPGGYAAIGWIILTIFVVGFLAIVGVIALVAWLILRRRRGGSALSA